AKDRLDAGEGIRSDVTTLESQRVELDVEVAEKQEELGDERLRLARLIGEPSSAAAWVVERWKAPRLVTAVERDWVEAALANRPEIQAGRWGLAALGDDLALARLAPFTGSEA